MSDVQGFKVVLLTNLKDLSLCKGENGQKQYSGFVDSEEEYLKFLSDLRAAGYSFSTRTSAQKQSGGRIFFSMEYPKLNNLGVPSMGVPFMGVPFQMVKSNYMICSHGSNYKTSLENNNQHPGKKRRHRKQPSKKIGCSAFLYMKCIRVFNDYPLLNYTPKRGKRNKIMEKLKQDLLKSPPPTSTFRYMVLMSPAEDHNHSVATTNLNQRIHPKIKAEIHKLVNLGICSVTAIKSFLNMYVEEMFQESMVSPPDKSNRSYYPKNKTINDHMLKALYKIKMTPNDIKALESSIKTWKANAPSDNFFFQPYHIQHEESQAEHNDPAPMMFCHQTLSQQELLCKHGNNISLLDAAYITIRSSLPLFFICVKTDSGYTNVGTFIVSSATSSEISSALTLFSQWNPNWQPTYFLCSFSTEEMNAIEQTFPHSSVFISLFHRDQFWDRWLSKPSNAPRNIGSHILRLWRTLASSNTENEFLRKLDALNEDSIFQENQNVQEFFTSTLLPQAHKWASAFLDEDFVELESSHGYKTKPCDFFHRRDLKHLSRCTLTAMVRGVIASSTDGEALVNWAFDATDGVAEGTLVSYSTAAELLANEHSYFLTAPNATPTYEDCGSGETDTLELQNQSEHSNFMTKPDTASEPAEVSDHKPQIQSERSYVITMSDMTRASEENNDGDCGQNYELNEEELRAAVDSVVAPDEENAPALAKDCRVIDVRSNLSVKQIRTTSREKLRLEDMQNEICGKLVKLTELTMLSENFSELKKCLEMLNCVEEKLESICK